MYKIYKLIDPNTKQLKYIGRTEQDLYLRLIGHLHEVYTGRNRVFNAKNMWIETLIKNFEVPIIELIEVTEDTSREKYWINKLSPEYNLVFGKKDKYEKYFSDMKSKTVYQYDLKGNFIKEWKSATEVEAQLNIHHANICACIGNRRKHAGGYLWRNFKTDTIPSYRKNLSVKPVHMYDMEGNYIKSYSSARNSEVDGFSYKQVSNCCTGKHKSHKNFKFSFVKNSRYSPILEETLDELV